jgi:hypothetical protein
MTEPVGSILASAEVRIPVGSVTLEGELQIPDRATGVVMFVHGSGSSRFGPRNVFVAEQLRVRGLGTVLFDLLTADEETADFRSGLLRFDIDMLAERLIRAAGWVVEEVPPDIPLGFFGASTGAAAALVAAAYLGPEIRAVVSRGGRPDLAGSTLERVTAPTLLIGRGRRCRAASIALLSNSRTEAPPRRAGPGISSKSRGARRGRRSGGGMVPPPSDRVMRARMFRDRRHAGQVLARHLRRTRAVRRDRPCAAARRCPGRFRGCRALGAPWTFVVRKLGVLDIGLAWGRSRVAGFACSPANSSPGSGYRTKHWTR